MSTAIPIRPKAALERLIKIAQGDTGQSRMTAEFLLSWWNAANCGGFDLTTLWAWIRKSLPTWSPYSPLWRTAAITRTTWVMARSSGKLSTLGGRH